MMTESCVPTVNELRAILTIVNNDMNYFTDIECFRSSLSSDESTPLKIS